MIVRLCVFPEVHVVPFCVLASTSFKQEVSSACPLLVTAAEPYGGGSDPRSLKTQMERSLNDNVLPEGKLLANWCF